MLSFLVPLLLIRQNPVAPSVLLPKGWRVNYQRRDLERASYLEGPEGQLIAFPLYVGHGDRAAELRGADPQGIFTYANLDGREVSVAIARDGRLAVSYPEAYPPTHSSFNAFDYWATVRTAREAVTDLLVVLTRVEAYKGPAFGGNNHYDEPTTPPRPRVANSSMSVPIGYYFRPNPEGGDDLGAYESPGKPSVEDYRSGAKGGLPDLTDASTPRRWEETRTILGRVFHVAEGEHGGLAAWVTQAPGLPPKGLGPVLTTRETSPQAAVVLVLTRLSFDKAEG